jgi:peptidoglycan/LPS O-acetylase OafA/YrhL
MGYFRFFLSLMVMADHLSPIDWVGRWAVIAFYALSGYGITAACQGKYRGKFKEFWVSRFWRLYPLYLLCWLLSAAWAIQTGTFGPMGFGEPWSVLMISWQQPTPIPQAWMFSNMLLGYLAISLGVSKYKRIVFIWLAASIFAYMIGDISIADAKDYHSLIFASLPFSLGALGWWYGVKLPVARGFDARMGELSYPIFLTHFLIGGIFNYYLLMPRSWALFFACLIPTVLFSCGLIVFFDKPLKNYKKLVIEP